MTVPTDTGTDEVRRTARTRRLTLWLFALAAAVYVGFIALQILRARS
ncbi:MAG: hypothetical protein JSR54_17600 [Proteobacteria bacterium]|nr:hypothetical protein [Pseudomonadota bacterium]